MHVVSFACPSPGTAAERQAELLCITASSGARLSVVGHQRHFRPAPTSPSAPAVPAIATINSRLGTYSMTSSASASNVGGISRPNVLAVLRLITNSNLVD